MVEVVDLDVVKDFAGANPESVTAGSTGNTFTITVTNNGPSNADDVQLTDTVDARLNVTGVSTNTGTCAAPAQLVSCDLNDLAPGASAVITVTYSVAAGRDRPWWTTPPPRPTPTGTPTPARTPSRSSRSSTSTS